MAGSSGSMLPGEFRLLAKVRAAVEAHGRGRGVRTGIGDDCAVVNTGSSRAVGGGRRDAAPALLLTTDTMVEGVHFERAWLSPRELGVRAFRAAVSDVAAMGGRPNWVLLSLEIPTDWPDERDALNLVESVSAAARAAGAALVGGNVSGGPRLVVTVTVVGETMGARAFLRSDAKEGDLVFVTGTLGGAAAGWRALAAEQESQTLHAAGEVRGAASAAYRRPPLRLAFAAALAKAGLVHAMIDVSDGLLQDLGHLCEESDATILIDPTLVPVHRAARLRRAAPPGLDLALTGGEDYELAFTAPPSARVAIERMAKSRRTPLTVIGFVVVGEKAEVTDLDGNALDAALAGFDHLRAMARTAGGNTAMAAVPKPARKAGLERRIAVLPSATSTPARKASNASKPVNYPHKAKPAAARKPTR